MERTNDVLPSWKDGPPVDVLRVFKGIYEIVKRAEKPDAPGSKPVYPKLNAIVGFLNPRRHEKWVLEIIQRLERYYEVEPHGLFARDDGWGLTDKGKVVYDIACSVIDAHDRSKTLSWDGQPKTVTVGGGTLFNLHMFPQIFLDYRSGLKSRADVDFVVREGIPSALVSQVQNGDLDLAFTLGPVGLEGVKCLLVQDVFLRPQVLFPPDYDEDTIPAGPKGREDWVEAKHLANYPFVVSDNARVLNLLSRPNREAGGSKDVVDNVISVIHHVRGQGTLGIIFGWVDVFNELRDAGYKIRPLLLQDGGESDGFRYQVATFVRETDESQAANTLAIAMRKYAADNFQSHKKEKEETAKSLARKSKAKKG